MTTITSWALPAPGLGSRASTPMRAAPSVLTLPGLPSMLPWAGLRGRNPSYVLADDGNYATVAIPSFATLNIATIQVVNTGLRAPAELVVTFTSPATSGVPYSFSGATYVYGNQRTDSHAHTGSRESGDLPVGFRSSRLWTRQQTPGLP